MKTKLSALCLLFSLFVFAQKGDSLFIPLPEKYEFTLKHNQETIDIRFNEWIPKKETFDNYSIILTEILVKNAHSAPLDVAKKNLLDSFNERAIGAKFTEIARELDYVIFKSEVDYYKNAPKVEESQLYFIIKGKYDLFIVSVAIREKELPEDFIKEWTEVFKNSKLHN